MKILSAEEARLAMDKDKNIRLLDVRSNDEYTKGHITGSLNIPLDMLDDIYGIIKNRKTKIFVYCQSGKRSRRACYMLEKMGYTDVTDIGGLSTWPYGIVK